MLIMLSPTIFISFFSIVFFINFCDGRSSLELIGIIGSQVLLNSNNNPQTLPPMSLPPFDSTPPLTLPPSDSPSPAPPQPISQPSNGDAPPSFCPLLPLPPPQQHRIRPPPSPGAPTPPIHVPATPGRVEPPPLTPPHKGTAPAYAVWCVAKPTVPEGVMQAGMDYACGSGADCKPIQVNGSCYQPDTLLAHASFAFNSYFQNKKGSGGTCDFGGTAMLVTVDPSFNGCHFTFI